MLKELIDWFLYSVLRLNQTVRWVESLNFFIYDSIKILFLLFVMILIIGVIRTYLPREKVKKWMINKKYGLGHVTASLFGTITPFCSCSSIPLFIGFLEAGIPLGITFSFLITSPIVNEYLVILMLGFFGWKITLAYVLSGIFIGTISGLILSKLNLENQLVKDLILTKNKVKDVKYTSIKERFMFGIKESTSIIKKLWLWILIGVGIGAIIHNYIPSEVIQSIVNKGGIFSIPIAVILGIPMYGNCAAIVPIALALFEKGMPIGTALAFMMAISALSFPEAIILRRAMKIKLILIFFAVVTLSIILTGYLFNMLQVILIS